MCDCFSLSSFFCSRHLDDKIALFVAIRSIYPATSILIHHTESAQVYFTYMYRLSRPMHGTIDIDILYSLQYASVPSAIRICSPHLRTRLCKEYTTVQRETFTHYYYYYYIYARTNYVCLLLFSLAPAYSPAHTHIPHILCSPPKMNPCCFRRSLACSICDFCVSSFGQCNSKNMWKHRPTVSSLVSGWLAGWWLVADVCRLSAIAWNDRDRICALRPLRACILYMCFLFATMH